MKKQYIHPDTLIQSIRYSSVLCASEPASEFSGGTSEGDAEGALAPNRKIFY